MDYPKLYELNNQNITIVKIWEGRWQKFNKATNKMEFKEKATDADKEAGFRLKFGVVIDGDRQVSMGYSQLKEMQTKAKVSTMEDLVGKTFNVLWNEAVDEKTGKPSLETRYMFKYIPNEETI